MPFCTGRKYLGGGKTGLPHDIAVAAQYQGESDAWRLET